MKRRILIFSLLLLAIPTWIVFAQKDASPTLEITGANASDLPTITITTNILDNSGRPIEGLTPDNFVLGGDLEGLATIVSVENITKDDLFFGSVLVIDVSSSMSGDPIEYAKEAARLFVQAVGEDDPVAIVAFSNRAVLVQDYTTDKDLLITVIDNLQYGGQTALYDAAVTGVEVAASSPVIPRRAVVLLSDGAEYGGRSGSAREDGLAAALELGVPIYTIGLGFGTDRSYLEDLSGGSNARNYESPTPEELVAIYSELATLFRTQYVITLTSDIPFDGTEYEFTLQTQINGLESNVDTGVVRAPIPVPLVSFADGIFDSEIAEPLVVEPIVLADDDISEISLSIGGEAVELVDGQIVIDPVNYAPGTYNIAITVSDVDGDSGSAEASFTIAALPSEISLNWDAGDSPLTEPQEISIAASGQTAATQALYLIAGPVGQSNGPIRDAENGFPFTLDPINYPAGDYTLTVQVENEGGATASVEAPFSVGNVAPRDVVILGLEDGQEISEPVTILVDAATQPGTTVESVVISIPEQGVTLEDNVINPASLQPGNITVEVTLTDNNGQSVTQAVSASIAALAPQVTLGDLPDSISGDSSINLSVLSQTGVTGVSYSFDDSDPIELDGDSIPIDAQALGDGEHTLTINVTNEGGETSSTEVSFTVALPTPTPDVVATENAQSTADAQATVDAQSTTEAMSATEQTDGDRQATIDANATNVLLSDDERATANAEAAAVEPTAENVEPTAENVEPTDENIEPTADDSNVEPTGEATTEDGGEATAAPDSDATAVEADATTTEEDSPEVSSTPTVEATLTPVEITNVDAQQAPPTEGDNTGLFLIIGGVLGLFVLIAILLFGRRRGGNAN